jgi:hypothetical protein
MKSVATTAGSGQNVQRAYDKRRWETLLQQTPSTDRLPERFPVSQTHLDSALMLNPEGQGTGWYLGEIQESRTVLAFKQVPSLVRAGTLPLQSRGQELTPKPRYSI